jgi:hypothetical protein
LIHPNQFNSIKILLLILNWVDEFIKKVNKIGKQKKAGKKEEALRN